MFVYLDSIKCERKQKRKENKRENVREKKKEKKNYSELISPHQQEAFIPLCAEPSFKCEMTKFKADPTSING